MLFEHSQCRDLVLDALEGFIHLLDHPFGVAVHCDEVRVLPLDNMLDFADVRLKGATPIANLTND